MLDNTELQLDAGDRVCLLGRNGCGKSTLLRMVDGSLAPDAGDIWRQPGAVIARMEQNLDFADGNDTVFDVVAGGLAELGDVLRRYQALTHGDMNEAALAELEELQRRIETADGWSFQQRIESTLSRLQLNAEAPIGSLSGGW
ncbi:MAG: ATP-binding cassette domain-containing protein, partial [Spongiibacter sp.]